jgi:hypothetical protein
MLPPATLVQSAERNFSAVKTRCISTGTKLVPNFLMFSKYFYYNSSKNSASIVRKQKYNTVP